MKIRQLQDIQITTVKYPTILCMQVNSSKTQQRYTKKILSSPQPTFRLQTSQTMQRVPLVDIKLKRYSQNIDEVFGKYASAYRPKSVRNPRKI